MALCDPSVAVQGQRPRSEFVLSFMLEGPPEGALQARMSAPHIATDACNRPAEDPKICWASAPTLPTQARSIRERKGGRQKGQFRSCGHDVVERVSHNRVLSSPLLVP